MSAFCANCIVGEHGLHWRRFDDDAFFRVVCEDCDPPEPTGRTRSSTVYRAIDVILESMPIRILRALRRFDWASPQEISDVLDIPSKDEDQLARNNFDVTLSRLYRVNQHVTRIGVPMTFLYKITPSGLAAISHEIARSLDAITAVR